MKLYDVIYADPPWKYSFSRSSSRKIENQYPTMALQEIKGFEVPANENSVIYLWATAPKLREALEVMEAWGFTYKTHMIWDKQRIGMGYWFRGQHELLLVGTKGKYAPPDPSKRISSVISRKRERHSRKPEDVQLWIERAFPKARKLELFAREPRKGWEVWGNEVGSMKESHYQAALVNLKRAEESEQQRDIFEKAPDGGDDARTAT